MSDDENNNSPFEIQLEAPPAPDMPSTHSITGLFSNDSVSLVAAKVIVLENYFKLTCQNLKYVDFLRELLLISMKVVKSEAGSLLEVDQENNTLFFRAVVGSSSDTVSSFIIPIGTGVVGHVAESRQPMAVQNIDENKIYLKTVGDSVGFEARNLVAVPIIIRGKVYGVLELLNRVGQDTYDSSDIEMLSYISEYMAKAIELRLMLSWSKNRSIKKDAA